MGKDSGVALPGLRGFSPGRSGLTRAVPAPVASGHWAGCRHPW